MFKSSKFSPACSHTFLSFPLVTNRCREKKQRWAWVMLVISFSGSPPCLEIMKPITTSLYELSIRPQTGLYSSRDFSNSKEILRQQRGGLNPTRQPQGDRNQKSKGRLFLRWVIRWANKSLLYVFKIAPINIASSLFRNEKPQELFFFFVLVLHLSNHKRWLFWSSLQVVLHCCVALLKVNLI